MSKGVVKIGIRPGEWIGHGHDTARALEWVSAAEELGFDAVFAGDRLLQEARQGDQVVYASTLPEVFTSLAAFVGRTKRIHVGPLVLVVPYRHPVVLAKIVATLDAISGGRVILPVGGGWNQREFDLLGISKKEAGGRLEETLEIIKRLWTEDNVSYEGRYFKLHDVSVAPRPSRPGGPPIWFGSFSPGDPRIMTDRTAFTGPLSRVLDRIGRLGDGWVPLTYSATAHQHLSPAVLREGWERISASARGSGRDPAKIDVVYSQWIYLVENAEDRRECEKALSSFFRGSFDDAVNTYLIGSSQEILRTIERLTCTLERLDWFILTPLTLGLRQLERIARDLLPHLAKFRPGETSSSMP